MGLRETRSRYFDMSAIPGNLDTEQQPPMTVPLRHFFVALLFLLAGALGILGVSLGLLSGFGELAQLHLLFVGWIALVIMGAMTQFVPVWSGTNLHSRRLANAQLVLVTAGLLGFTAGFLRLDFTLLAVAGGVMLAGFWLFVYNLFRTLRSVDSYDITERHFLLALAFFCLFTTLGVALAINYATPILSSLPVGHANVLGAHATLAVFGAVLTTIYGAIYQLGTMFTQTELRGIDHRLQRIEEFAHPLGVVMLAGGRLFGSTLGAQIGGVLVSCGAIAVAIVVGRKLLAMQVERTPMHSRYAVVVCSLLAWSVLSVPAWLSEPLARDSLLGGPGVEQLLVFGVVSFVILGTLYHIVPFIIWIHEYSDLLGFEPVPMVDDLYDHRLAALDFWLFSSGTAVLVVMGLFSLGSTVRMTGGVLVALGAALFFANMALVVVHHSESRLDRVLFGSLLSRADADTEYSPSDR